MLFDEEVEVQISISGTRDCGHFGAFSVVLGPTNNDFCPRTTAIMFKNELGYAALHLLPFLLYLFYFYFISGAA